MRPALAVVLVAAILGGLQGYMSLRDRMRPPPAQEVETSAAGIFSLDLTLTFDAGPDPFALDLDDAPSLLVEFRGQQLLRETGSVPAGQPIVIAPIRGVDQGKNEFFVKAVPADSNVDVSRAVRVRVLRDGEPISESTLWSEPGLPVQGKVDLVVPASAAPSDDHDHTAEST
jgi:hypothetical protein